MSEYDFTALKKPAEYGDEEGTVLGRPLTAQEVHDNFLFVGKRKHGFIEYLGATSTTWVAPVGVAEVVLNGVGQGGNGGTINTAFNGGAGGGSGAWCRNLRKTVVPGTSYTITLSTTGDSTFFGVTLGKGGNGSGYTAGAGGVGSGGASNGSSGGTGAYGAGAGGGGIGGSGASTTGSNGCAGGGSGGPASEYIAGISYGSGFLSGVGGSQISFDSSVPFVQDGGIGAGGSGGWRSGSVGGNSIAGGGGGGAGGANPGGSGGPPFLRIDW